MGKIIKLSDYIEERTQTLGGKITNLFAEVGADYLKRGVAETKIRSAGHDVHAFFSLSETPSKVIHVQGYPKMSSKEKAMILIRLMGYGKMMKTRKISIPYDSKVLENLLAEIVPELG